MDTIVLASRNEHKIEELRAALSSLDLQLKSALDFPKLQEVEEDKETLEGNAIKKARYVFNETGLPALADDTGLEVEALGGRPGVYSARYAGEEATDRQNVDKLLDELAGLEIGQRSARFRTVVAFVTEDEVHTCEGVCSGEILKSPSGENGFGYDPVFRPEGYEQSFAGLSGEVKNKISHRGRAIQQFYEYIQQ